MSDPQDELTRTQLERITALDPPGAASLSEPAEEEAAALRESWLAFGRLLESANDDFDEAVLLARVRGGAVIHPTPSQAKSSRGRWVWAIAAAASLVAAIIVWRAATEPRERPAHDPAAQDRAIASRDPALPDANSTRLLAAENAWDDALDARIADAGEQLIDVRGDWRGYDAPYAAVDRRLQELSDAVGDESL
jgi:hypothetical protein